MAVMIGPLAARDRHKTSPPQDQIEVVAHLPLRGEAVTRFLVTQHYRREYLYAAPGGGKGLTLIDVTNAEKPTVLAEVDSALAGGNVVTAAGTAVLLSDSRSSTDLTTKPHTFRIMSFADPAHPVVSQEFANVSAIERDDRRGLIFVANEQGLWILHQSFAVDPEFEKEWKHVMLDNR